MKKSRRGLVLGLGGLLILAAGAALVFQGIRSTLLLEHQAALVFEGAAAREAHERVEAILRAVDVEARAALDALAAAAVDRAPDKLRAARTLHPIVFLPFLIAQDGSLLYPPLPGPALGGLASEDPPPEEFAAALRASLEPPEGTRSVAALHAVAAAPEVAWTWRLRARAATASRLLGDGHAAAAEAAYQDIESDFADELQEMVRPSRIEILCARTMATAKAGRIAEARTLLLETLDLALAEEAPARVHEEAALVLRRGRDLDIAALPDDAFHAALARREKLNAERSRGRRLAQVVAEWVRPRLLRGGAAPDQVVIELPDGDAPLVWIRPSAPSDLAAVGLAFDPERITAIASATLTSPAHAAPDGNPWPFELRPAGPAVDFHDLDGFPLLLRGQRIGVSRDWWERLLRDARRPFRIAAILIGALGCFLALSGLLVIYLLRREFALSRMKTELVANVSHELKTPLALIRLFGETLLLGRVKDEAKMREYHEVIVRESERLSQLVANVLSFASLESGARPFQPERLDLRRAVEETLAGYRLQLEGKGFHVDFEVSGDIPPIGLDRAGATQAFLNLLDNAVKYSPGRKEGGNGITVRLSSASGRVRLSVADRGIGISAGEREKIFDLFYRSPHVRTLGLPGSGLGLALVRHIAAAHGGSVEVESTPGEGSTFTLSFPIAASTSTSEFPRSAMHEKG